MYYTDSNSFEIIHSLSNKIQSSREYFILELELLELSHMSTGSNVNLKYQNKSFTTHLDIKYILL